MSDRRPVRRALVSVFDKTGLEDLVRGLADAGVELVSTGGSAAAIDELGLPVTKVEDLTGFPECLDGRVKTLHPRVHAGILADTRLPDHVRQLEELEVAPFDLVVVNLYPFADTVASGAGVQDCIEKIDIGGPTMVRAAAKNHASVAIVTDPTSYGEVLESVRGGGFTPAQRERLATEAFIHTATYDVAVASWLGSVVSPSDETRFPGWLGGTWAKKSGLRYGENPHQGAALYVADGVEGLAQAEQLHGKEMSYNNYVDADAALRAAHDHAGLPTVAIIKHANPCGIAVGETIEAAYERAHACDPVSAYGGIVASNRPVTAAMATALNDTFSEVVLAPDFDADALTILREKKNRRLLKVATPTPGGVEMRPVSGGLLVQDRDAIDAVVGAKDDEKPTQGHGDAPEAWTRVTGPAADEATLADLAFAWRAVRATKSNAILLAKDKGSVGIGMGQVNRVDSCHLAVGRAGAERAKGAVAASDAFFPFADGLQVLLDAGVSAVVAPGGSVRDEEVVAAAEAAGITMYFTGTRHFAH
ncbi:bifunctional phosphoribosylaminoimidazolecarboxamide formyltransferase/IMP cyclohydrolase [Janibacter cremeus]|uniref:bifunctional phosphoribosylaminoimidazolecarboxamide formyltransferase/IMP cyclohydrolase n=1 Tax=Janibacter cremeus TaxID=1285192 RepID=UPI0023F78B0E|nr:bifunctional phosphoribosylaminoimidazolecarboxamide formyltransferase/IMP cyclohydrolase [Janibacter cremeus]WEV79720.1 bifunctional phosphoribosylaminoimidazolecarboxamide formyltransferase/IMP cyclohydrolase [Janibacter cremeus]